MKMNKVYLIGAGPGAPDLITVRGLNVLKEANVVIYDYLVDKRIFDNNIKKGTELICCDILNKKGKYKESFSIRQREINNLIIKKAREGKKIVRLKNGNPCIFSRISQELDVLVKNRIPFEIIPGITASSAGSCLTGIPLTDRRFASSYICLSGQEELLKKNSLIDWSRIANNDTIVLYMAVGNLTNIIPQILKTGKTKDTAVAIIENISLPNQRVLTGGLGTIAEKMKNENITSPAIVIIGKVVELEKNFNWLKKNKRVLFTGLSKERFFTQETYFHLPLIKIEPLEDYKEFDVYIKRIKYFDWIIFSSRYGVNYFFERVKETGKDTRVLSNIKIAAIGNSTKNQLLSEGICADIVPTKESSEGLIEKFQTLDIKGKKIFLPRSDISDKGLSKALTKLGAKVYTSFAYRNVMPKELPDLDLKFFDEIVFTSPSTVRNFKKRYKILPEKIKIRCIGDVTQRELNKQFMGKA